MYTKTKDLSHPKGYFPKIDLSKSKIYKRLEYLPRELEKRKFLDQQLIHDILSFTESSYDPSKHQCLVHGDLKSPHIIKTKNRIYFIDLALISVANPWYDLAFLFMEEKNKNGLLERLSYESYEFLGESFNVHMGEVQNYLKSNIFYRLLYNVIFAARHRSDKSLIRTINELQQILNE